MANYMTLSKSLLLVTVSILLNGFIGFVFGVFAAAGAGNSNNGSFFMDVVFPIWIGSFIFLILAVYFLAIKGRHVYAVRLPMATIPVLVAGLFLAGELPVKQIEVETAPAPIDISKSN